MSTNKIAPGARAQRPGTCHPRAPRENEGRSLLNRYEKLSLPRAGSDSRPVPPPAGRGLRSNPPVQLLGTGPRTLAGFPRLAQGRASAAGASFPLACRRVCGDHTKLLCQQRRFLYIGCPRPLNPMRPKGSAPIGTGRGRWV